MSIDTNQADVQILYSISSIFLLSSSNSHEFIHMCERGWSLDNVLNINNNYFDDIDEDEATDLRL